MSSTQSAYIPGVCNINTVEVAKRRQLGRRGVGVFAIALLLLLLSNIDRYYRIILFLPAFAAATGYLQARNKFCVGYAAAGQQNAQAGSKKAQNITDKKAVALDKKRARRMNGQALIVAVVMTVIVVLIPHIS